MSTNFVQHIWHRLVGARGLVSLFPDPISVIEKPTPSFGKTFETPADEVAKHKLVFFGESHSMAPIIAF